MPEEIIADDPNRIEASPTKEFFIFMLTRDIDLTRAIADLVDNCVDGAKRLRGNNSYDGLVVRIDALSDRFKISDNCGGISIEVARKYAFRFGRAEGTPETPHSIGQFGVGMKRALFKIGNNFLIESRIGTEKFMVIEDIREWAKDKTSWDFRFSELQEGLPAAGDQAGTTIEVTGLFAGIAEEFQLENFQGRLRQVLSASHQQSIHRGMQITLNGIPLNFSLAQLLSSDELSPVNKSLSIRDNGSSIDIKLFAGLGASEPSKAGWNIFCNGRLILQADKSRNTGWGDSNPHYHNEYARFRGYVFFDSDNSALLPWNTTKSDVDADAPHYRAVRLEMIQIMRPIIDFLIRVAAEKKKQDNDDPTPLESKIAQAQPTLLDTIPTRVSFESPRVAQVSMSGYDTVRVSFSKPRVEVNNVKNILNVGSYREVGERVFEYFIKMECE